MRYNLHHGSSFALKKDRQKLWRYPWEKELRLDNVDWKAYYEKTRGRPPRSLLLSALALENRSSQGEHGLAIDLGFGDGTDTLYLLENGWSVLAIDGEPAAKERLLAKVPAAQVGKLTTRITSFESLDLPPARLIYASLSLPFCHPDHFAGLWHKIDTSLWRNGRFAPT